MKNFNGTFPYPPSVNTYWLRSQKGMFISKKGREFRKAVVEQYGDYLESPIDQPVRLVIEVYLPDRRKRDLDNILKPLLDSLEHANIITDDYLINEIHITRCGIEKPGHVDVHIWPFKERFPFDED